MSAKENVLKVSNLKTYIDTSRGLLKAVDNVSFGIGERKSVGIVGESGSGKSMTALSVMRLIPPQGRIVTGEILFKGRDLLGLSDERMRQIRGKDIAMVFQDPMTYLNPLLTIGEQIAEAIRSHEGYAKPDAKKKATEILNQIRIANPSKLYNYYPHQMSGGMRQRVLIGIALACNPALIIADEPTTALDVTVQAQILELIKDLCQKLSSALLLITHDLGIVAEVCDEVNVMYAGQIVENADVYSLYEDPLHPYTQGLLRSALSIDEFKEDLIAIEGMVPDPTSFPSGCRFHPRCPKAMKICLKEQPPNLRVGEDHAVSCWLYK